MPGTIDENSAQIIQRLQGVTAAGGDTTVVEVPDLIHYRDCYTYGNQKAAEAVTCPADQPAPASGRKPANCLNPAWSLQLTAPLTENRTISDIGQQKCMRLLTQIRLARQSPDPSSPTLDDLLQEYTRRYTAVYRLCKRTIVQSLDDLVTLDGTLSSNNAAIRTNMGELKELEQTLRLVRSRMDSNQDSVKTTERQARVRLDDRVRIGPSVLPLGHVSTRFYVIAMVIINTALVVAIVILLKNLGGAASDSPQ